jgi:glycosidase
MKSSSIFIIFICLFLNVLSGFSQQTNVRVDPPFWWTGMETTSLQLMFHGDNIAETNAVLDYPGVVVERTVRLENPNYIVLNLEIKPDARPGRFPIVFEYQREIKYTVEYELFSRKTGSAERKGFGKEDVIYLIIPDRFSNGDKHNDSVTGMLEGSKYLNPNGRHGGDLRGIRDELDHLTELGITALWLCPVLENNGPAYTYHGYAITDFYRVDPRFGSNDDYLAMVEECHEKGLKVIMDMVFNHCGGNHFWIKDLPMQNWIHQFPEYTNSNFRIETAIDPYASDYDRDRMLTGWFDKHMPDLNQHNEILAEYLIQNSIWWIEYAGLDGIRMDTYPYSYKDFMAGWMKRLNKEYPDFNVVGETWIQKESHTAYWQDGSPVSGNYHSGLKSVTDFPMQYALKDAFNEPDGWTGGLLKLYYVLSQDFLYNDPFFNVIFADNHDLTRFYSAIKEDYNKFRMAMAVLLTTRGIPLIYYGTEYLMTGDKGKDDGYIRQDFPVGSWQLAVGSQKPEVTSQQKEALQYMTTLLNWRKSSDVILSGKLKQFIPQDGIYVYFRYTGQDAVMVIINKNKEIKQLGLSRFNEVLKDYQEGIDIATDEKVILGDSVSLAPERAYILELD